MKKMISILTILILVFLTLGCTGSKTEYQNGSTGDAVQPTKTLADKESDSNYVITPTPTPVVTPTPTQPVYQDIAWLQYVQRYLPLIGTDFTNAGSAANNSDYTTLSIAGQNIVDDTQKALDENNQYNISPKYQDAKNEWTLALKDYNSAGEYLILVADDGKIGKTNTENLNKFTSLCSSGTGHLNRVGALIQTEAGTA